MTYSQIRHFFSYYYLAIASFIIVFLITLLVYQAVRQRVLERNEELFDIRTVQAKNDIENSLRDYIQILKGGKALFKASDSVSRENWELYVKWLQVDKTYPGIQGIAYAPFIRHEALPKYIASVRAEGFPNYTIYPEGERSVYTPVTFIEPFVGRNLRAFGFDMFSNLQRRQAMERARDSGDPMLSAKVRLVQETSSDVQSGFLICLPVYAGKVHLETTADRRQLLKGFVYCAFRAKDMMMAILGKEYEDVDVEVYDGTTLSAESILFDKDSVTHYLQPKKQGRYHKLITSEIAGHTWSLFFTSLPAFEANTHTNLPDFILLGGIILSLLVLFIGISQANVRRSNHLKQTITDNATAALFMIDAGGYCTFMNPAAEQITGFTFEEIRQKPLHDMIHHTHPDGRPYPMAECPLGRALPTNNDIRAHEDVFIRKDGTYFPVSCAARPIFEGGVPMATVLEVRDVTEIKEAEHKIKRNAWLLQKVFEQVPAIVGLIEAAERKYVLVNPLLSEMYGNRQLLGKNIKEAHPDLQGQGLFELVEDVFRTGKPYVGNEISIGIDRHLDGNRVTRYFNIVYQPLFNDHDEVEAVLLFAMDVTELVTSRQQVSIINKELTFKNQELTQINNDLDNFVYTASHDLKAPIANLEGLTSMLRRKLDQQVGPVENQLIGLVQQSVNKLQATIRDLAEITKVQKEKNIPAEPLLFEELLKDVTEDIRSLITEAGAKIRVELEVKQVMYARKNLRSILYNLLSNAIKYRSPERLSQIHITTRTHGAYIVLRVQDNGLGLKPSQQEKLFSMFKRFHTHVEGTGIGLYIVKRIIENNGGKIDVESEYGKGTTFIVCFKA
jgi:PAS domain S-box-containing protein